MAMDVVADAINMIMNAETAGKSYLEIKRYSSLLLNVLKIAKQEGYIENFEIDDKDKILKVIIKKITKCKSVKPRFNVKTEDIEKYMRRYLPSRNFGILIISTNKGLMTHNQALEENAGGKLIAYFY